MKKTFKRVVSFFLFISCVICSFWNAQLTVSAYDERYLYAEELDNCTQVGDFFFPNYNNNNINQNIMVEGLVRKYDNGILYGYGYISGGSVSTNNNITTVIRAWSGVTEHNGIFYYQGDEGNHYAEWYYDMAYPEYAPGYVAGRYEYHYVYIQESAYMGNDLFKCEFFVVLQDKVPEAGWLEFYHTDVPNPSNTYYHNGTVFRGDSSNCF